MDISFDPTKFHPTFLGDASQGMAGDAFHKYTMESFLKSAHEYGLPSDVISSSVESAYNFFGLEPAFVFEGHRTYVSPGNPTTMADDMMSIDRNELMS